MTSKTVYWNGLTEGQHRVWVAFEHDGDTRQTFSVPFEVSGLPISASRVQNLPARRA